MSLDLVSDTSSPYSTTLNTGKTERPKDGKPVRVYVSKNMPPLNQSRESRTQRCCSIS